jgi:glycosyltransferase involved in cell wall biosynthesis
MTERPIVSVVLPCFNGERFLEQALESVLAQTFRGWELLVVDDGSTDGSADIARAFARRHPDKIRYLEHEGHVNLGMSASRNRGIREAAGQYVAFLDADDMWFPTTLDEQVAILDAHPHVAMVYGPIQYWYSWTGAPDDLDRDIVETAPVGAGSVIEPPALVARFLVDDGPVPSGILVRRTAVDEAEGYVDAFRGEYEDQAFLAKICLRFAVYAAPTCWYRYRQHDESCTAIATRTGQATASRVRFLRWLDGYLTGNDFRSPEVWRALRHERLRWEHPRRYRLLERVRRLQDRVAAAARVMSGWPA